MAQRPRRAQRRSAESEVRRLLADARHTQPMPVDVAGRLDGVLADLAAQRRDASPTGADVAADVVAGHSPAPVVDLAARRRRRAGALLVAAAAVVALGVGVDHAVTSPGSGSASSSSADRAASAPAASAGGSARARREDRAGSARQDLLQDPGGSQPLTGRLPALPRVRPDHFTDDAARVRGFADSPYTGQAGALDTRRDHTKSEQRREPRLAPDRAGRSCPRAPWGRGRPVVVRYDHALAVLVLRPARGETQVVDLFRCGSTELLRSSTLPLR